ncbi:MAG: hypothetical protein HC934_12590 [Acaryochloridaceae cyanobacterium SU_2_1]|nr:hypothetical protein [Acaryochloridaceae cyanobacterium SU_2_1]NJM95060.1 hypothetical protein [Acaryochloridaceae cyanobacterium CSU_5_19]
MTTHFITAEIDLQESSADLHANINNQLQTQGEPLRWAVTQVEAGKAQIEAVVLSGVDEAP